MARPVTLFTGQWADLPFERVCELASDWGYDGLEIAASGDHFDVARALEDDDYAGLPAVVYLRGFVTELAKYVRKQLPDLAREKGKTDAEKGQTPVVLEFQSQDFVITNNPTVMPKVRERLDAFAKLAKDLPMAQAEEGRNFLSRMPKLEAQQSLRKAYQKLADATLTADAFQTVFYL